MSAARQDSNLTFTRVSASAEVAATTKGLPYGVSKRGKAFVLDGDARVTPEELLEYFSEQFLKYQMLQLFSFETILAIPGFIVLCSLSSNAALGAGGAWMNWLELYLGVAALVTAGSFAAAGWFGGRDNSPWPDRPMLLSLVAGFLWPILVIGLLQLPAWMLAAKLLRSRGAPVTQKSEPAADLR